VIPSIIRWVVFRKNPFIVLLLWLLICPYTYIHPCFAKDDKDELVFETIVDFGFGSIDEDTFVLILPEQGLRWKGLDLHLAAPIHLRIVDKNPADNNTIRQQDWDEPSDFARILRSLSFVHSWPDGAIDLQLGQLNGVGIGQGALADNYFNSTDVDHYQGGVLLKGETRGNGGEFTLEDVVRPEIFVGRIFLAPIGWFLEGEWPRRLEVGYTIGADMAAPRRTTGTGNTYFVSTGGDISIRIVDMEQFTLLPFLELMVMDGDLGVHLGLAITWTISKKNGLSLNVRGEYRYSGSDYHPAIFNPFYEYNRRFYDTGGTREVPTFADHLADSNDFPGRHGSMGEIVFEWNGGLRIGARYDTEGKGYRHWVMFRLELFPWEGYSFSAFYAGQDVAGRSNLFGTDSLMGAAARGRLWGPIDIFIEFTRRWRRLEEKMDFENEIGGGVGLSISY
jgi:hypothetical protein